MTDPIEIDKVKLNALTNYFTDLGYKVSTKIGQNEFRIFLNKKSKSGRFDPLLADKLFEVLNLDEMSTMSIEEFVTGFVQFDEEIKKNAELFKIKLAQEQEIYDKILKQCRLYQSEKLNAEGFCENAKIYGEITDIDIKQKLEGIKEIIIIVIYNEKKEELHFKIGDKDNNEFHKKKSFGFKPTSRKDHFEFIMKGVNEKDQVFDIGSKVFPLDDIGSQEEYLVQIVIPEMDNPNKIVAYINTKIVLYMSDYKYYEALRRKQEKRLKKYMAASTKATEYLKYVREIYGDLSQIKPELIVDFNNEKLMQRKGAKLNVNFNNMMEAEETGGNYFVEFNNEREVQTRGVPLRVEFNNSKEVLSPVTQTEKKYEYKYNYTSKLNQNIINDLEKKIEKLQNEKENITNNLQNIPKPNLEQISIKKTTENIILKNPEPPKEIPPNVYTNEQVITETTTQQIIKNPEPVVLPPPQTNSQIIQETTTETTTQNISEAQPKYITTVNPPIGPTQFDVDSYLKYSQSKNNSLTNAGYIQKTTETTKTTTTTPIYENNTYLQSVNGQQSGEAYINSFLSGQNINQYNLGNATTTTTTTTTTGQDMGSVGYGTYDAAGRVSEYEVVGNILKEKTITTDAQTLDPIINKIQVNSSYNNAIFNETTNNVVVSENTLPVSYLPEKVNQIIVDNNVTTLPVITSNTTSTSYNTLQPIIHETQTVYTNGSTDLNNLTDINNINITSGNTYGTEYNYSASSGNVDYTGNIGGIGSVGGYENISGSIGGNFGGSIGGGFGVEGFTDNNYNATNFSTVSNGNNNYFTTQTTETTTTQVSQYEKPYIGPVQDSYNEASQQIQYGV
jgi:hypothetical protein